MTPKNIILVVLSMSLSFGAVLALIFSLSTPPEPPKVKVKKTAKRRIQLKPAAPSADRRIATPAQLPGTNSAAPEPVKSAPPSAPIQQPEPKPVRTAQGTRLAATSKEIQLFKKQLRKQISVLERDRNDMIAQLARQLAATTPPEAAAEIRGLDDETAALVLKNMSTSPRLKLLKHLDEKQARRLDRHMKIL